MTKLTSDYFQFEVITVSSGKVIWLAFSPNKDWRKDFKEGTLKTKEFFLAGDRNSDVLRNFMNSLTDEQCGSHFGMRWDEKKQAWKMKGER